MNPEAEGLLFEDMSFFHSQMSHTNLSMKGERAAIYYLSHLLILQ